MGSCSDAARRHLAGCGDRVWHWAPRRTEELALRKRLTVGRTQRNPEALSFAHSNAFQCPFFFPLEDGRLRCVTLGLGVVSETERRRQ